MPGIVTRSLVFLHTCLIGISLTVWLSSFLAGNALGFSWLFGRSGPVKITVRSCQVKILELNGHTKWLPCNEVNHRSDDYCEVSLR